MHIITSTQATHDTLAHGHAPANLCHPSHTQLDRLFVLLNEWTTVNFTSFIPKDMQASSPASDPRSCSHSAVFPVRIWVHSPRYVVPFRCPTVRLSTRPHVILAFIYWIMALLCLSMGRWKPAEKAASVQGGVMACKRIPGPMLNAFNADW